MCDAQCESQGWEWSCAPWKKKRCTNCTVQGCQTTVLPILPELVVIHPLSSALGHNSNWDSGGEWCKHLCIYYTMNRKTFLSRSNKVSTNCKSVWASARENPILLHIKRHFLAYPVLGTRNNVCCKSCNFFAVFFAVPRTKKSCWRVLQNSSHLLQKTLHGCSTFLYSYLLQKNRTAVQYFWYLCLPQKKNERGIHFFCTRLYCKKKSLYLQQKENEWPLASSDFAPALGTPRRQGLCSPFDFVPALGTPKTGRGYVAILPTFGHPK